MAESPEEIYRRAAAAAGQIAIVAQALAGSAGTAHV